MFDKYKEMREKVGQKADSLQAEADAQRVKPFYETDDIVGIEMIVGGRKQALNTCSDYKKKGFRIAGIVEQEATHSSLIIMEKQ